MLHVSVHEDRRQAPKYVIYNISKYAYTCYEICDKQVAFADINKIL
jgi:hypothetical protein